MTLARGQFGKRNQGLDAQDAPSVQSSFVLSPSSYMCLRSSGSTASTAAGLLGFLPTECVLFASGCVRTTGTFRAIQSWSGRIMARRRASASWDDECWGHRIPPDRGRLTMRWPP
jgi:hypothetical protein